MLRSDLLSSRQFANVLGRESASGTRPTDRTFVWLLPGEQLCANSASIVEHRFWASRPLRRKHHVLDPPSPITTRAIISLTRTSIEAKLVALRSRTRYPSYGVALITDGTDMLGIVKCMRRPIRGRILPFRRDQTQSTPKHVDHTKRRKSSRCKAAGNTG